MQESLASQPPPPKCQCDHKCKRKVAQGSPFCAKHSSKKCPVRAPLTGVEPIYNPDFLNTPELRKTHNCYAYAIGHVDKSGQRNRGFAQPGYAAGYPRFGFSSANKTPALEHTCSDIITRVLGDNPSIVGPVKFTDRCPPKTSKIAFVVDPRADFHVYRQDSDGWWSHKPGETPVTDRDAAGNKIWAPHLSSRYYPDSKSPLNYSSFCGYYCVRRDQPPRAVGGKTRRNRRHRSKQYKHTIKQ